MSADLIAGLVHVHFDPAVVTIDELTREARRVGAETHCAEHCPLGDHDHASGDLAFVLPDEHGLRPPSRAHHRTRLRRLRPQARERTAAQRRGRRRLGQLRRRDPQGHLRPGRDQLRRRARAVCTSSATTRSSASAAQHRATAAAPRSPRSPWLEPRGLTTILSGVAVVAGFVAEALQPAAAPYLFAAAMMLGGAFVARAAVYALRARTVDMNVLMTVAALGAAAIGEWSEAGLVMFLFALGNQLQALTVERTRRAVKALATLAPAVRVGAARRRRGRRRGRRRAARRRRRRAARRTRARRRDRRRRAGDASTSRRSPASRCLSRATPATRSSPDRSSRAARSRCGRRRAPTTRRSPASSTSSKRRRPSGRRCRARSTGSRPGTRRSSSRSPPAVVADPARSSSANRSTPGCTAAWRC